MTAPASAPASAPAPRPGAHLPSALQFALSGLAVAGFASGVLALLFLAYTLSLEPLTGPEDLVPTVLNAAGLTLSALLVIPSAVFALLRLLGRRIPSPVEGSHWRRLYRPGLWLALLPVVIGLGYAVQSTPLAALVVLPPLHLLAMSLPAFWLAWLARRRLVDEAPQRYWGVLAAGLALGPLLIGILEVAGVLALMLAAVFYVAGHPVLMQALLNFSQLSASGRYPGPEDALQLFSPFLADRGIIFLLFFALSVVTPLIEEAFKPIGVWLLAGRRLTPAEGFAAGALSGAGFALFENLTRGVPPDGWAVLAVARIGTTLLHVLTSGLVGYALALAWREGRWLRLAAAYLAAVALHGLWNGSVIAASLAVFRGESGVRIPLPESALVVGAGAALALALGFFIVLLAGNRSLRRAPAAPSLQRSDTP